MGDPVIVVAIALVAGLASPLGGLVALWRRPSTLFTSVAVGFAAGVLLATVAFEMLPKALELGSIATAVAGFLAGLAAIYALDLYIHRGRLAGERADESAAVKRFHARRRPRGSRATVLAGGSSAEEVIEGITIGVGAAIEPGLGLIVAASVVLDNIAESISIGTLMRDEGPAQGRSLWLRVLGWTGLIGASLFFASTMGWFLLGGLSEAVLGPLFAAGAGGMFYLTVSDLIPEAEHRHYQQSAALAAAAGFTTLFVLSSLV